MASRGAWGYDAAMTDVSLTDLTGCIDLLETIAEAPALLARLSEDERVRLFTAAGRIVYPDREEARKRSRAARKARKTELRNQDRAVKAATTIRALRVDSV